MGGEKGLKLICPVCHSRYSMAEATHEKAMREMIDLASKFGHNWGLVFDYSECFRAAQWGSVREQKRLRLLKEIWGLFEKSEFEIDHKKYRTDRVCIIAAIRAVVDAEKFGFRNHNYLKRVLITNAERVSAEGLTAKEEAAREKERRRPTVAEAMAGSPSKTNAKAGRQMTGSEYKKSHGIESLVDGIGTGIDKNKS